jgi:hypothetical protein
VLEQLDNIRGKNGQTYLLPCIKAELKMGHKSKFKAKTLHVTSRRKYRPQKYKLSQKY